MSGKNNDDGGNDLDKWIETQRREINKLRDELLGQSSRWEKDIQSWTEEASSSIKGPFERFKDFVDSNFSTLSNGVRNFPSNVSELKARMQQEREVRVAEERDIWRRWTGSDDSPDHIKMQVERLSKAEREEAKDSVEVLIRLAEEKNRHVPAQKILNLYRDNEWSFGGLDTFANPMLSFGGACYYKPETVENLTSTARWGWPKPSPQWLSVDWFKRSPYSPIRLEADSGLPDEGSKWRAAFEDLMSASLGKPMVSEEKVGVRTPHGKPQSTYYGPGLEWMLSMQCRGVLPPQLPNLYRHPSLSNFDGEKGPQSDAFQDAMLFMTGIRAMKKGYPVTRDMEALVDEVAIKSGPMNEASPLRSSFPIASPRVPETEQDLYDEMPPLAFEDQNLIDEEEIDEDDDDEIAAHFAPWKQTSRHDELKPERSQISEEQTSVEKQSPDVREESTATQRPDILAQLTTTKRTRLPDGTVTTKVVLKQRFADGTEEEHETTHISREEPTKSPQAEESQPQEPPEEKKKGGWFWN